MDLRDYLGIVRKSWAIIVALVLVGIAIGSLTSILVAPMYQATTKVFISVQSSGTVSDLTQGSNFTQNQVKSYADVVTTPAVLQPVIDSLNLDMSAGSLANRVTASTSSDTVVVEISVADKSAQQSADIANAVAASFKKTVNALVPGTADGTSPVKITVLQSRHNAGRKTVRCVTYTS